MKKPQIVDDEDDFENNQENLLDLDDMELDERDVIKHGLISLPYYKQGDDLFDCFKYNKNDELDIIKTFREHQRLLTLAIEQIDDIIGVIEDYPDARLDLEADTHMIEISGDKDVMQALINKKLVNDRSELMYE